MSFHQSSSDSQNGDVPTVRIQAGTPVPANSDKSSLSVAAKTGVVLPSVHNRKSSDGPTYSSLPSKPNPVTSFTPQVKQGMHKQ